MNKIASRLVRRNGGRILLYRDLPVEARHAIAWYMAMDGEAWDCPKRLDDPWTSRDELITRFKRANRFFVNRYGNWRFGYVEVTTPRLVEAAWEYRQRPPGDSRFVTFSEYHRWYLSDIDVRPYSRSVWPVILNGHSSDEDSGLLEDGWHRFHAYLARGVKTIPCVWHPQRS